MYSKKLFSKSHYYVGTEAYLPVHLEQGAIYIAIDTRTTWCYDHEQNPQQINPTAVLTSEQQATLEHFRYNPETDKLEGDRSIETLLSSLYLGTAWKISSAGDAITFVTEELNEAYFPITYGFKDHENPAYQGQGGFITPKVASVDDLLDIEIFGPAGAAGTSTDYTTSGVTTDDVFIFSIQVIIEQEIVPTDIILYEFFGGPDFSYPLVYEQRLTNLSLQPGDVLHMQFSNPLKQIAGSNVSTRLAYARNDAEIQTRNIEDLEFIKVRPTAADPNQHYSKVQLRFYTEDELITEEAVIDLIDTEVSAQDFMRQGVFDPNNIGLDVFDMENMIEGFNNKILTALERITIVSNSDRLDIVEGDITSIELSLDGKVDDAQVLTNVPAGALFTDTIYDDTALDARVTQNESDITALQGVTTHDPVTLSIDATTQDAASLNIQELTLNQATQSTDGVMPAEDKVHLNNIVFAANFWLSGLMISQHDPKNLTVDYDPGAYEIAAEAKFILAPGNLDLTSSFVGMGNEERRLVEIYVDADEVVKYIAGPIFAKDGTPIVPMPPSPSVCLAIVELRSDKNSLPRVIEDKHITDCRMQSHYTSDEFVKVSSDDTVSSYLFDKLSNNGNVTFTVENVGGNETIKADAAGGTSVYGEMCVTSQLTQNPNATTPLVFDTNGVSTGCTVDALTGRITILEAGDYEVFTGIIAQLKKDKNYRVRIFKNGVLNRIIAGNRYNLDNAGVPFDGTALLNLAVNDYLELTVFQDGGDRFNMEPGSCFGVIKL